MLLFGDTCYAGETYKRRFEDLEKVPNAIPLTVKKIYLSYNQISTIDDGSFGNNSLCETLHLDFNQLTVVRPGMWLGLYSLKWLSLDNNNIKRIQTGGFANLPHLRGLYMRNNKLKSLSESTFLSNPMVPMELDFGGNRLRLGDPNLCWVKEWLKRGWIKWFTLKRRFNRIHAKCQPRRAVVTEADSGIQAGRYKYFFSF